MKCSNRTCKRLAHKGKSKCRTCLLSNARYMARVRLKVSCAYIERSAGMGSWSGLDSGSQ